MAKTQTVIDTPPAPPAAPVASPWEVTTTAETPAVDTPPAPVVTEETPPAPPVELAAETEQVVEVNTVTVFVPKLFLLTLDDSTVLTIKAGVQELNADLVDHWYVKANNVEVYTKE
jgi:hypothetical protein